MKFNNIFDWFEYLFFGIGLMTIQFIKGNIDGAVEITYWVRIHLSYRGKCVGKSKLSFIHIVKNKLIELLGIIVILSVLFIVIKFILYLKIFIKIYPKEII